MWSGRAYPVVAIGRNGVTESVLNEFSEALDHHELVKVKLAGVGRAARDSEIERLQGGSAAILVQSVGRVACFYRRNDEKPRLALPR